VARKELNLGIVAHVDAGKTTLTERLLYAAGVIAEVGSVDAGTTQTDSLALERQRGITIRTAVASFDLGDVHVNLIDTPGHPDFIAEVERALSVLDGAVLVISAVEGVQPQTRILMRALQRLRLPTLLFVNKTDRTGADVDRTLRAIARRLTPDAAPVEFLDDDFAQLVESAEVYPVFAGSALTGDGVQPLLQGIAALLPPAAGDPAAPPSGTVFKIEDGIPFVRMWSGAVHVRERLEQGKVTAVAVFEHGGTPVKRQLVAAGAVARIWGLGDLQIGDRIGAPGTPAREHRFPPPTLEAVVAPRDPDATHDLRIALNELAQQDPLIGVRQDEDGTLSVSLYGEVQQQVLEATLADDYGLDVEFREPTIIYVERPRGTGEAVEILNTPTNPFDATVGLRIEPAGDGSGVEFRLDVPTRVAPLHLYKSRELFADDMRRSVGLALREGVYGWRITDCLVTMTECEYAVADGPPSKRGSTSQNDFRALTPIVLAQALTQAGTIVCEPILDVTLEVPASTLGAVLGALGRVGAAVEAPALNGELALVDGVLPVSRATELQRELPRVTSGEGVFESAFAGYRPVAGGPPPTRRPRPRTSA
jgi:ribosomal protection tetracycline resistance protein